ncbi:MAG: YabP/YqfC family sporulation protein [Lachnospiraceae bacterium]|nr:YabP/YqfC family sporulation protein [Lachnospiraceae bacterium]
MGRSNRNGENITHSIRDLRKCIPPELNNGPMIELCSNREITVDGCKGIVEYSEFAIKIKTGDGMIAINGRGLNIKYLSVSSIVVDGYITGLEFIK